MVKNVLRIVIFYSLKLTVLLVNNTKMIHNIMTCFEFKKAITNSLQMLLVANRIQVDAIFNSSCLIVMSILTLLLT